MIAGGEVLLTMAEVAVGLAGFSGVVAAFSRTREDLAPEDRVRFLLLVGALGCRPCTMILGGNEGSAIELAR